jgi:hypothetical protein
MAPNIVHEIACEEHMLAQHCARRRFVIVGVNYDPFRRTVVPVERQCACHVLQIALKDNLEDTLFGAFNAIAVRLVFKELARVPSIVVNTFDVYLRARAILTESGRVIVWGALGTCLRYACPQPRTAQHDNIVKLVATDTAFFILNANNEMHNVCMCLPHTRRHGVSDIVVHGVSDIVASDGAVAALMLDGSARAWGEARFGGVIVPSTMFAVPSLVGFLGRAERLSSGVVSIVGKGHGFCAHKADGSSVEWGMTRV